MTTLFILEQVDNQRFPFRLTISQGEKPVEKAQLPAGDYALAGEHALSAVVERKEGWRHCGAGEGELLGEAGLIQSINCQRPERSVF